MLFIGSIMVLGMVNMIQEITLLNYGMFIIGFAMIINGVLMVIDQRKEM